jgi:hypothetical protein
MDEHLPSLDDQLGYTILYSDVDTDHIPVSPYYTQDQRLCADLFHLLPDIQCMLMPALDVLTRDSSNYAHQVGAVLRSFRSSHISLLDPSLYLHDGPWIRYILAVEDEQRAVAARLEEGMQRRRSTRNSQKSDSMTWLSLSADERRVLCSSGFSL